MAVYLSLFLSFLAVLLSGVPVEGQVSRGVGLLIPRLNLELLLLLDAQRDGTVEPTMLASTLTPDEKYLSYKISECAISKAINKERETPVTFPAGILEYPSLFMQSSAAIMEVKSRDELTLLVSRIIPDQVFKAASLEALFKAITEQLESSDENPAMKWISIKGPSRFTIPMSISDTEYEIQKAVQLSLENLVKDAPDYIDYAHGRLDRDLMRSDITNILNRLTPGGILEGNNLFNNLRLAITLAVNVLPDCHISKDHVIRYAAEHLTIEHHPELVYGTREGEDPERDTALSLSYIHRVTDLCISTIETAISHGIHQIKNAGRRYNFDTSESWTIESEVGRLRAAMQPRIFAPGIAKNIIVDSLVDGLWKARTLWRSCSQSSSALALARQSFEDHVNSFFESRRTPPRCSKYLFRTYMVLHIETILPRLQGRYHTLLASQYLDCFNQYCRQKDPIPFNIAPTRLDTSHVSVLDMDALIENMNTMSNWPSNLPPFKCILGPEGLKILEKILADHSTKIAKKYVTKYQDLSSNSLLPKDAKRLGYFLAPYNIVSLAEFFRGAWIHTPELPFLSLNIGFHRELINGIIPLLSLTEAQ